MIFNSDKQIDAVYKKSKSILCNARSKKSKINNIIKISHLYQNLENISRKQNGLNILNFQKINAKLLEQLSNDEVTAVYKDLKDTFKGYNNTRKKKLNLFNNFLIKNKKFLQLVNILYSENPPEYDYPLEPPFQAAAANVIANAPGGGGGGQGRRRGRGRRPPLVNGNDIELPPVTPAIRNRPQQPPNAPNRENQRIVEDPELEEVIRAYEAEDFNNPDDDELVDYDDYDDQKSEPDNPDEDQKSEPDNSNERPGSKQRKLKKKYRGRRKIGKTEEDESIYEDNSEDSVEMRRQRRDDLVRVNISPDESDDDLLDNDIPVSREPTSQNVVQNNPLVQQQGAVLQARNKRKGNIQKIPIPTPSKLIRKSQRLQEKQQSKENSDTEN